MSGNRLDIVIKQGQNEERVLTIKDDSGVPVDISTYSFASKVRDKYRGREMFSFVFEIRDQLTNPGEVKMSVAGSVTALIRVASVTNFVYDVEMTASLVTTRIMQGKIVFDPEVTT